MAVRSADASIRAHAADLIRQAGHSVNEVYSVRSAGDTWGCGNADEVLFVGRRKGEPKDGPDGPRIAYMRTTSNAGMRKGYTTHIEVEDGW